MGDMGEGYDRLAARLLDFVVAVIQLVNRLPGTVVGRHIGGQLVRAATSAGANYEEARAGESHADFLHKMQVVLKELREAQFWLRLVSRCELRPQAECQPLLQEAGELCAIFAKSIVTAKKNA